MSTLLVILAQNEPKPSGGSAFELPIMLIVGMALLYLIVLRPASRRQEQERQARVANLQKNDKVLTTAGIYGTVVDVGDKDDVISVKVDDNVRIKMTKASILLNISHDERVKAEKEKEKAQKGK
jgi:preprotein translocase subunit YajC